VGHSVRFCPLTPTVPAEKVDFVEHLLAKAPFGTPEQFEGYSKDQALLKLKTLGAKLNEGNPWAGSVLLQDQLRSKLGYWAAMGSSPSLISWLAYGINCQFESEPDRLSFRNHPGAQVHEDFLTTQILEDVRSGALEKIPPEYASVINPLHVQVKTNGKKRKLDDERHANSKLAFCKFKQETLKSTIPDVVHRHDKLFSIDLKSAYYFLPMFEAARPYFCSMFKGEVYCPRTLMF
jgi:hypothetical protein